MKLFKEYRKKQNNVNTFWLNISKQFQKNKLSVLSFRFIKILVIIALLADILANEKPLVCNIFGRTHFPVFKSYAVDIGVTQWEPAFQNISWKDLRYDWALFPPIPYQPRNIDDNNIHSVSPFDEQHISSNRWRHWLGTDELGHDVMAALIHGTRIALFVGVVSMSIASLIGILLGSLAGYFGDDKFQLSRARLITSVIFIPLAGFYAFSVRGYILTDAIGNSFGSFFIQLLFSLLIFIGIIYLGNLLSIPIKKIKILAVRIKIPVDLLVSRFIEIMLSIPTLFLIISIVAISKPSIFLVMTIIGLTSWTGIARFIRAELLRIRNLEYIEATHALGYSEMRTILYHAIPNAISPVLIAISFGIANAILIESSLSFLGVGIPADTLTWGSLLSEARQSPSAWWLAVFPGMAIFLTVTFYNLVGEGLTDALDPRSNK